MDRGLQVHEGAWRFSGVQLSAVSDLYIEAGSHTKPGAHHFSFSSQAASLRIPCVSASRMTVKPQSPPDSNHAG